MKIKYIIITSILLITTVILTACEKNKTTSEPGSEGSNFSDISSVNGVSGANNSATKSSDAQSATGSEISSSESDNIVLNMPISVKLYKNGSVYNITDTKKIAAINKCIVDNLNHPVHAGSKLQVTGETITEIKENETAIELIYDNSPQINGRYILLGKKELGVLIPVTGRYAELIFECEGDYYYDGPTVIENSGLIDLVDELQ